MLGILQASSVWNAVVTEVATLTIKQVFGAVFVLLVCVAVLTGLTFYSLRALQASKRRTALATTIVFLTSLGIAFLAYYCGEEASSAFWVRQTLVEHASDIYILERVRSVSFVTASPAELRWLDSRIGDKKRLLMYPAFQSVVNGEPAIANLLSRAEKLRQNRLPQHTPGTSK